MLLKCSTCKGVGKILGLGTMQKKCPRCKGVCYIEDKSEQPLVNYLVKSEYEKPATEIVEPSVEKMPLDKRSKEYKDIIKKIMAESEVSKEEAIALYESTIK